MSWWDMDWGVEDAVDAGAQVAADAGTQAVVATAVDAAVDAAVDRSDPLWTYGSQMVKQLSGLEAAPDQPLYSRSLADTSPGPGASDVKGSGPKAIDTGSGVSSWLRKFMGLPDTEGGQKQAATLLSTAAMSAVKGAAEGYSASKTRKLLESRTGSDIALAAAQADAVRAKSHQNLDGLTVAQPGLMAGGFKPAPFIPVKNRATVTA